MRGARGNFVHRGREDGVWSAKAKTERDAGRREAGAFAVPVAGSGFRIAIPYSCVHMFTSHLQHTAYATDFSLFCLNGFRCMSTF